MAIDHRLVESIKRQERERHERERLEKTTHTVMLNVEDLIISADDFKNLSSDDKPREPGEANDWLALLPEIRELDLSAQEAARKARARLATALNECMARGSTLRELAAITGLSHQQIANIAKKA